MIFTRPKVTLEHVTKEPLIHLEKAGRTCYKSEKNITKESSEGFINRLIGLGHESVIEHAHASVRIICDRGISHQLVRHRLASFSQESTRYVNYTRGRMMYIIPHWLDFPENFVDTPIQILRNMKDEDGVKRDMLGIFEGEGEMRVASIIDGEMRVVSTIDLDERVKHFIFDNKTNRDAYYAEVDRGATPEQARGKLNNHIKTELVMTTNLRHWRLILKERLNKAAHSQAREVANMILEILQREVPVVFDDFEKAEI